MITAPSTTLSMDFVYGAGSAAALLLLWKLVQASRLPSTRNIEALANQPIPPLGDNGTITVWGFEDNPGAPDVAPYVARVECFLRLNNMNYVKAKTHGRKENPRGQVPLANVQGIMIDDSSRIINYLIKKFNIDYKLTAEQIAMGHLIRSMLYGSLYWVFLYESFATQQGRDGFRKELKKDVPAPLVPVVLRMFVGIMMKNMTGQGIAKVPYAEVAQKGKEDLRALQTILGKNKYILGTTEPTVYDSDVYAFVNPYFFGPSMESVVWVQEIKSELPDLIQYAARMRELMFPNLKNKKA